VRPKHGRDKWMHSCFLFTLLEYGGMAIILFQHKFQNMTLIIVMFLLFYKAWKKRYQSRAGSETNYMLLKACILLI